MKIKPLPSWEFLNECLELDSTSFSGLRWKIRPLNHFKEFHAQAVFNGKYAGKPAGNIRGAECIELCISFQGEKRKMLAHRVVYTLNFPLRNIDEIFIDHRDRNALNNSISNLREATNGENMSNINLISSNKSGYRGVSWDKARKKWEVKIKKNGQGFFLGRYDKIEDAAAAYRKDSLEIQGEFSVFYKE